MEQLQQKEDLILELGKKIVKELELDNTTDTLSRWMIHYISELMVTIEESTDQNEKESLKKECCDLIFNLWNKREIIPIGKPINHLKPIVEIIELLKKESNPFITHKFSKQIFEPTSNIPKDWINFLNTVKENSLVIYIKTIENLIDKDFHTDSQWVHNYSGFLSKEEKTILEYLSNNKLIELSFSKEEVPEGKTDIIHSFLNEIELNLNEQLKAFNTLKESILNG